MTANANANGLELMRYLTYLFKELAVAKMLEDIEALLPWNVDSESLANCYPDLNRAVC